MKTLSKGAALLLVILGFSSCNIEKVEPEVVELSPAEEVYQLTKEKIPSYTIELIEQHLPDPLSYSRNQTSYNNVDLMDFLSVYGQQSPFEHHNDVIPLATNYHNDITLPSMPVIVNAKVDGKFYLQLSQAEKNKWTIVHLWEGVKVAEGGSYKMGDVQFPCHQAVSYTMEMTYYPDLGTPVKWKRTFESWYQAGVNPLPWMDEGVESCNNPWGADFTDEFVSYPSGSFLHWDLNGDYIVNTADFNIFLANYG